MVVEPCGMNEVKADDESSRPVCSSVDCPEAQTTTEIKDIFGRLLFEGEKGRRMIRIQPSQ